MFVALASPTDLRARWFRENADAVAEDPVGLSPTAQASSSASKRVASFFALVSRFPLYFAGFNS